MKHSLTTTIHNIIYQCGRGEDDSDEYLSNDIITETHIHRERERKREKDMGCPSFVKTTIWMLETLGIKLQSNIMRTH